MRLSEYPKDWLEQDISRWTPLHREVAMIVANAPLTVFADQAYRLGEFVRLGLISRGEASELLKAVAIYNQLGHDYGPEFVRRIITDGLDPSEAA